MSCAESPNAMPTRNSFVSWMLCVWISTHSRLFWFVICPAVKLVDMRIGIAVAVSSVGSVVCVTAPSGMR